MLATYFSFSDYSGQNLIRAFTGTSTISDYDISGVRINTPPKKYPYTYNFELYNSNVSVETYSITFVLSKALANSNTKLASLCEFSKYQGSLVTYNVATTDPLTGAITGTAVSHSIGFLEAMSIAFLEDANHDLFECTLTIGSFDSLVNKTLETTAFPKSYGYGNLITPLFDGTVSGRNSYKIGGVSLVPENTNHSVAIQQVLDGGVNITTSGVFSSDTTTLILKTAPSRELRVCTLQSGSIFTCSGYDGYMYLPNALFKVTTASYIITTNDLASGNIEVYGTNDLASYSFIRSTTFNIGAAGNLNLFSLGITNTTVSAYATLRIKVTDSTGSPRNIYCSRDNIPLHTATRVLYFLAGELKRLATKSYFSYFYTIASRDLAYAYMSVSNPYLAYPVDANTKVNIREVINGVANSIGYFTCCTVSGLRIIPSYIKPYSSLPTLPFAVQGRFTQYEFVRPPYKGNWKISYNKKASGGYSDIAGSVSANAYNWYKQDCDYYISGDSSASYGINPEFSTHMEADTYLVSSDFMSARPTTLIPPVDVISLIEYKTARVYKVTFKTYDYTIALYCDPGAQYKLPSGTLPFDTSYTTFIVTSNDVSLFYDSNAESPRLITITGDLYK